MKGHQRLPPESDSKDSENAETDRSEQEANTVEKELTGQLLTLSSWPKIQAYAQFWHHSKAYSFP